ncbi:MAG TPA: DUF3604 domain-containing protein [Steroidobacteraceae bacterium]|nr:DUF3604 domain-containing protein [Steroidobacteraceae bacterium]
MKSRLKSPALLAIAATALAAQAFAAEAPKVPANPLRNAYFGELHLHTAMSFDAFLIGTRVFPETGYKYARGEEVEVNGQKFKRRVPLDFCAVTDHSEYLGQMALAGDPKGPLANTIYGQTIAKEGTSQKLLRMFGLSDTFGTGGPRPPELLDPAQLKSNWQRQIDAANGAYQPGKFTTFVGYEWSALPNGANLHRNVIFKGPGYPELPFSSVDSAVPEELWRYIRHQRDLGREVLAIPHNSNVSDGLMFSYADSKRDPIDSEYAATRQSIERLVEITQTKGTSETRPELSPNDEFANFENVDSLLTVPRQSSVNGGYVRQAYGRGLEIEKRVGTNPFEFGLTGSSDLHTGLVSSDEKLAPGYLDNPPDVQRLLEVNPQFSYTAVKGSTSGVTGVWAESNTRESIFDALYRREVFATSGTYVKVRLFAGFDYAPGITKQKDWIRRAYASGVAMGSDLSGTNAPGRPLKLLVHAVKDPDGGNLDRIQVIKVWLADGKAQERIFDVAWAGDRKADDKGRVPAIGSTVQAETATYTNTIGATELVAEWQDPTFKAGDDAVYYARVLEIPTPRWSTYLAVANKLPVPTSVPSAIQERAWTSPVFYRP